MLTPPSFTKESKHTTFTAELSTRMEKSKDFFLPLGKSPCELESKNDSFSFNTKSKEIFNPVENFSCVKKETPKFGRAENQTSTPSQNMIRKLTLIRNQIRFEKSFNQVFNKKKNFNREPSHSKLFPGEKARIFQNKIQKRNSLVRSSKKINRRYVKDMEIYSPNSSFLSKSKRVTSQKRSKKGPKIFGKKHLQIFHSKFNLNRDKDNDKLDCFISNGLKIKPIRESEKRKYRMNYKENNSIKESENNVPVSLSSNWNKLYPMLSNLKPISNNPKIKAKHLPKVFQDQFREQIINSFRNISTNVSIVSSKKETKNNLFGTKSHSKNMKRKLDQSVKRKRKMKLNLRYQSARKCNVSSKKDTDLGLTQRNLNKKPIDNQFLMRELKFMINNKKKKLS